MLSMNTAVIQISLLPDTFLELKSAFSLFIPIVYTLLRRKI